MRENKLNDRGFGLVEIVIAVAIISFSVFSLFFIFELSLRAERKTANNIKASFLLEEGIEAAKIMRDTGWGTSLGALSSGLDYYLVFDGLNWQVSIIPSLIDGFFERKFIIEDVLRDANDDISEFGTIDPDTKNVIFYVSWQERGATTTSFVSSYITNIFNN
ncbi:MAG: type II secretion system GspH family protein [Parcubacteria group bacterium]|nr:type II secretion system GspH family protein [Parcubacteria group bacterium]MCR4342951.1 type II secretion system GspH family protein [Patescibacteria group bacterium]